jgi:hypothetical protein
MTMPSAEERETRRRHIAAVLAHRRDIAQRINANEPAWDVMYGLGSRRFWAFPCWRGAPNGLIVSAADPGELLSQMRVIETRYAGPIAAAAAILDRCGGEAAPAAPRHHSQT